MDIQGLKDKILQLAIQGKLVEQDKNDEPASVLLQRIKEERDKLVKEGKIRKPKKLAPIEQEEKPFEIPEGWEWVRLGEISYDIHYGYTASAKNIDTGVKMLRITDIQDGKVIWENVPYCEIEESKIKNYKLKYGDILIARTGGTIGKSFLITDLMSTSVFASYLIRVELSTKMFYQYISYFLNSNLYWEQLRDKSKGTGQPNVNAVSLSNLLIPLPPLSEQKLIVEKVDGLFALIDELDSNKEDLLEVINLTRNQVLQEAIQGKLVEQNPEDEPASLLLERIKEERDKLVKEGKIKKQKPLPEITEEEKPFKLPEGWEWVRFGNLVEFKIGKTPTRGKSDYWDNGKYPWFSISDIKDGEIIYDSKEKISEKAYTDIFKGEISPKGTLIMSFKLSIGKMSILGVDGFHNEAIISIFPICDLEETTKMYLFRIMDGLDILGDSKSAVKGATLNTTSLNNILIPLPPLAEQKRIVEKLDMIMDMLDEIKKQ
ncbi:restriction endonuclease subunit S [Tissierella praeacuta]|uniref:restriction endonuclease subunit S n=1 Tax=Tissierella praeacuta TaxID=43131 RepID=UPI001C1069EF|nr:restriction endonuclease subunit S [Tissierella praeacuta]MBU5257222.1 restriction endonuclease subunit S [Tissierella praeacuta]